MSALWCNLFWIYLIIYAVKTAALFINALAGSQIQLTCNYRIPSDGIIIWIKITPSFVGLAENAKITAPEELRQRLNITVIRDNGQYQYHLNIFDVKKTDEGRYECSVYGDTSKVQLQQLVVIVGPTSVQIINNTADNKLEGTEGQSLQIKCEAAGGSPQPDVKLLIAGSQISVGKQSVTYTIPILNRSHDRQMVECLTGYTAVNDFPLTDSSELHLKLKPLVPLFNLNSVSVIEGNTLVITCSSSGNRPAAVFQWEIGSDGISSSSQITSSKLDPSSNTYTVVSRLTYTLTKDQNGLGLICKAINLVVPGGVPAVPIIVEVKYPPTVIVDSKTVTENISPVVLTCNTDGNPNITTNYEWTHETLQGTLIRRLNGVTSTLTLPPVNSSIQYQNTGRYNCTVGNDIPDTTTRKTGSGVLTVNAPPTFTLYNHWGQGGEKGKPASIFVDVYSVPSLTTVQWYRGNTLVSGSGYRPFFSSTTVKVMFHETEVEVGGFRVTLTINDVKESDFTSYRLVVSNSRGSQEQHITFVSTTNVVSALVTEKDGFNGAAVGISVVTVISIVINMAFLYKFVAERRKPTELHNDQTGSKDKDMGCYDNIPETVDENSLVDDVKYESLGEKDRPNVYEDFDKDKERAQSKLYSNTVV